MPAYSPSLQLKLNNVLVATTFSKMAVLYATSIARQHGSKLFVTWRASQAEITEHVLANRLDEIQYELLVRSGDIWSVLSQLIAEMTIDHVVVGTRDTTRSSEIYLRTRCAKHLPSDSLPCAHGREYCRPRPGNRASVHTYCNRRCSAFSFGGEIRAKPGARSAFIPCTDYMW
jgi:hypothetical protein